MENSKKFGGNNVAGKKLFLRDFMQEVGAIDLGFIGRRFTWSNNQSGGSLIKEWLDRALASNSWVQNYHEASVTYLAAEVSDHSPILLNTCSFVECQNLGRSHDLKVGWDKISNHICRLPIEK